MPHGNVAALNLLRDVLDEKFAIPMNSDMDSGRCEDFNIEIAGGAVVSERYTQRGIVEVVEIGVSRCTQLGTLTTIKLTHIPVNMRINISMSII